MPAKSPAQERLMQAAAHTKGGYGGVPQSVGKEFVSADSQSLCPITNYMDTVRRGDAAEISAAREKLK